MRHPDERVRPGLGHHAYHPLRQLAHALRLEARLLGTSTVLDAGCGSRPYRSVFDGRFVGVDVTDVHGLPDVIGVAERLPLRAGSFDVVLSTQHLEHAADPLQTLHELRRVLRPNGMLLLSTHGVWPYHPDPEDLWRWTADGLCRLVQNAGFRVERMHRAGSFITAGLLLAAYPLAAGRDSSRRAGRITARAAIAAMNLLLYPLDAIGRRLRVDLGSAVYLVAARVADGPAPSPPGHEVTSR